MTKLVPYLSEEQIERDAAALLAEYERKRGVVIEPPIPIEDIVEKHLKLGIEFDDTHRLFDVPRTGLDPDILGAIFFDDRRIVIDDSLDPEENPSKEGRYRFTLAHEGGGHWRLHRHLFAKDPAQAVLFGALGVPSVICRSSQAKERVELQADFFASCLLMPKRLVLEAWFREFDTYDPFIFDPTRHDWAMIRRRRNGPRAIGDVLCDMSGPDYTVFFDAIAKRFSTIFYVSRLAMRIRLEKLGLLLRELPRQRNLVGNP